MCDRPKIPIRQKFNLIPSQILLTCSPSFAAATVKLNLFRHSECPLQCCTATNRVRFNTAPNRQTYHNSNIWRLHTSYRCVHFSRQFYQLNSYVTNPFISQECFSFVSVVVVNFHRNLQIKFVESLQSVSLKMSVGNKEGFCENAVHTIYSEGGGGTVGFQIIDLYGVSNKANLLQFVHLMALQGTYFDHIIACNCLIQRATYTRSVTRFVMSAVLRCRASIAMGIRFQHRVLPHDVYAEHYKPQSRIFISHFPDRHVANTKTIFKCMERCRPTGSISGTERKRNFRYMSHNFKKSVLVRGAFNNVLIRLSR
jgi:hypothetical protein